MALDLMSGLPIVFNRHTTPACSVVEAVLASCAIPGAFPSGRLIFTDNTARHPFADSLTAERGGLPRLHFSRPFV